MLLLQCNRVGVGVDKYNFLVNGTQEGLFVEKPFLYKRRSKGRNGL